MRLLTRLVSRFASRSLAKAASISPTETHTKYVRAASMTPEEIAAFLGTRRVLRIAFDANDERYLIPLGYLWIEDRFYCMTQRGRKTRMASMNPKVSFQVDDSSTTSVFTYISVCGDGKFEIVTDAAEIERVMPALASRFPDTPDWYQAETAAMWTKGELLFVRICPQRMSGVCSAPPNSG